MAPKNQIEDIQKIIARHIATHPVGRNLAIIGGFRYRFLDDSARTSDDIDYHWAGNLDEKQKELIDSFRRVLIPEISRLLGYSGRADARTGPDTESPVVRVVDLAFWKDDVPYSRIEIPVEITRIICEDPIEVRTVGGTIYATVSEGDMIESKVIAIFGRIPLRHRDIVDVFLYQDRFHPHSAERLKSKLHALRMNADDIGEKMRAFKNFPDYHARAIQEVIDTQLDLEEADQLNDSGGGRMVFHTVIRILNRYLGLEKADESD